MKINELKRPRHLRGSIEVHSLGEARATVATGGEAHPKASPGTTAPLVTGPSSLKNEGSSCEVRLDVEVV